MKPTINAKIRVGVPFEQDIVVEFDREIYDSTVNDKISVVELPLDKAIDIFGMKLIWNVVKEGQIYTTLNEKTLEKLLK